MKYVVIFFFIHSVCLKSLVNIKADLRSLWGGGEGGEGWVELKCTCCIPLPYTTDTSHRLHLTCRVLKMLIVLFSQAAKYNYERLEPRSHFKSSLMSLHKQCITA